MKRSDVIVTQREGSSTSDQSNTSVIDDDSDTIFNPPSDDKQTYQRSFSGYKKVKATKRSNKDSSKSDTILTPLHHISNFPDDSDDESDDDDDILDKYFAPNQTPDGEPELRDSVTDEEPVSSDEDADQRHPVVAQQEPQTTDSTSDPDDSDTDYQPESDDENTNDTLDAEHREPTAVQQEPRRSNRTRGTPDRLGMQTYNENQPLQGEKDVIKPWWPGFPRALGD